MVNSLFYILGILTVVGITFGVVYIYKTYILTSLWRPDNLPSAPMPIQEIPEASLGGGIFTSIPAPSKQVSGIYLPEEIEQYCDEESDEWAKEECKQSAMSKFPVYGDWDFVMQDLERANGKISIA